MYTSPGGTPEQTFKTIEMAGTKRLSRGWTFNASYSATKKYIPVVEFAFNDPQRACTTRLMRTGNGSDVCLVPTCSRTASRPR